jgi:hypothetical protein
MKKTIIAGVVALSLTFGGVAGASVTKLMYSKEGLKENYTERFEAFAEEFVLGELRSYEEDKVAKLEQESEAYFESKKEDYKESKKAAIDADYEKAREDVQKHIDNLFK